jgi:N,N-dimethylformamidase
VVPLIGYLDRFSARPGERIAVKVSSWLDRPYRADLVRIIHADANPAGPGIKPEDVPVAFNGTYPARFQPVHLGSCGVVQRPPNPFALPDPSTIVVRVQPWLLDGRPQTVLAIESGPALSVGAEGARIDMGDSGVQVATPMLIGYELRVIAADGRVRLRQTGIRFPPPPSQRHHMDSTAVGEQYRSPGNSRTKNLARSGHRVAFILPAFSGPSARISGGTRQSGKA